ncbi:site-specific DNA-methyltransferase [Algibacter sp. R77976]|uniref:site-specific DNA-methyltransferase n=1 Tax=Algibacter sp. R77976 TaxID=3093873 RepID=UPI0037C99997
MSTDKLDLTTPDLVNQNIEKIAALFPNCVTETAEGKAIDFDLLKQELNHEVVEGAKERYRLEWPGKKEAIVTANLPTTKTLRPVREDSVNFDTTENMYIEGDNLEVLKILQESYLGKIKMIYIDPPYNTGKDFVYKDNFTQDSAEFKEETDQTDEYGNRLVANPETAGRYHSDWLSMMYPRLKLSRNLLTEDGAVFVSIDDNEIHNLRKVCDIIFGEINFVCELIWQKKTGSSDAKNIATITEYILVYSKNISKLNLNQDEAAHDNNRYKYKDEYYEERGPFYYDNLDRGTLGYHETLDYGVATPSGAEVFPNGRTSKLNDGWRWKWGKNKLEWGLKNGFIEIQESSSKECGWGVYYKIYLNVDNEGNKIKRSSPYKNIIQGILNTHASNESKSLFNKTGIFSNPKPVGLLKKLSIFGTNKDDILLDFFSGSATSAHAIMQLNAEDGGNRKYIMVQLPEITYEGVTEKFTDKDGLVKEKYVMDKETGFPIVKKDSEARKTGYYTIPQIGKERIRRAAAQIKEETNANIDYGFKVFKVESSNMQDVYYKPQDYDQAQLDVFADNIKEDRTSEDLLTQILLDWGLPLTLKTETLTIQGKEVFKVDSNYLMACFANGVDEAFAKEIATYQPLRVVFKDSGFKDDTAKENVKQLLKQLSPNTEMKVI